MELSERGSTKLAKLADRLHWRTGWGDEPVKVWWGDSPAIERLAADILAAPQSHVDAMVEAGVLQHGYRSEPGGGWHYYQVIQPEPPHKHVWLLRTDGSYPKADGTLEAVHIQCSCGAYKRLPID